MSRNKKSRSLKRVTGGVKTGTKERTKLENKQKKARKKASSVTAKDKRQRSVYQKMVDDQNSNTEKKSQKNTPKADSQIENIREPAEPEDSAHTIASEPTITDKPDEDDLWDQFENPESSDTF